MLENQILWRRFVKRKKIFAPISDRKSVLSPNYHPPNNIREMTTKSNRHKILYIDQNQSCLSFLWSTLVGQLVRRMIRDITVDGLSHTAFSTGLLTQCFRTCILTFDLINRYDSVQSATLALWVVTVSRRSWRKEGMCQIMIKKRILTKDCRKIVHFVMQWIFFLT